MKRRTFIKNLGLAAGLPYVAGLARGADAPASKAESASYKILTCNIRVDVPADSQTGDGWAHRKAFCARVIRSQKADLIGFQEMQAVHFKDLKAAMPEYDSYALANPDPVFHPANAIFYSKTRFELISAGGFWLSEQPHVAGSKSWDSARSRFANWVDLRDKNTGKQFRFWNTHFDHIGQQAREHAANLIIQASDIFPKEFPQLWTMDANASPVNGAIKAIITAGWVDTFSAVHPNEDAGTTFHGFQGPKHKGGKKIDWIFCRGPIQPKAAAVIRDGEKDHYPSDHYFVSAEVSL